MIAGTKVIGNQILLGKPIPDNRHAVSVSLPTYQSIVDYEKGKSELLNQLQSGYPRFRLANQVEALFSKLSSDLNLPEGSRIFAFNSRMLANQALNFVSCHASNIDLNCLQIHNAGNLHIVSVADAEGQNRLALTQLKLFWQHTGSTISSRQAESLILELDQSHEPIANHESYLKVQGFVAENLGFCNSRDVFLEPNGMAAIYFAHRLITKIGTGKTVQFGFPYTDTLKIQQKFGTGCDFFGRVNEKAYQNLEQALAKGCSAVFLEFPSNPLLESVDLQRIHALTKEYGVPLVIDDTIGTSYNVDLSQVSDIIVTSLTKFSAGSGDVMGGSLALNPNSALYGKLAAALRELHEPHIFPGDLEVMAERILEFRQRMRVINRNAESLADFLSDHPMVDELYYPKFNADQSNYAAVMKEQGGYGGLMSVVLKNPEINTPLFFDNLILAKGPSLGTDFTLVCLYTLLAHYQELDLVQENYGVNRNLIRVSVGTEDPAAIEQRFSDAFKYCQSC